MSTKAGIYHAIDDRDGVYLYEEVVMDAVSPAYIQIGYGNFKIEHEFANAFSQVTIEVPAEEMDRLAIAWLKHRSFLNPGVAEAILKDVESRYSAFTEKFTK